MKKIQGTIPPIITPMNEDESVNFTELKKQVRRMLNAGVHGIFPFGTNGEAYALSNDEKIEILKTVVEEVSGAVPVYAGTGCVTTKDTVELSIRAQQAGADILSVITPYFAAVSQSELYHHYKEVAEAVDLPIVLYNIPMRTGDGCSTCGYSKYSRSKRFQRKMGESGSLHRTDARKGICCPVRK